MKHVILLVAAAAQALGQTRFEVSFPAEARSEPATGRLVVMLIRAGAGVGPNDTPLDGPFWFDPQPMYGVDVRGLKAGAAAIIDDRATGFPTALSGLPAGDYRAQARLDVHRHNSDWKREPGNLYSDVVKFTVPKAPEPRTVAISLSRRIEATPADLPAEFEVFTARSALLSEFRGEEVRMRASVVPPIGLDPAKKYAAIYHVPGFGGDHTEIGFVQSLRAAPAESDAGKLARSVFIICLDPEGPNGHTLFADSANNGPCGRALVEEFIPALEEKYPLVRSMPARLLRGHSSGGWSTLWLVLNYQKTFGAAWSSSPDPVDFRRFQLTDIYQQANMYDAPGGPGAPDRAGDAGQSRFAPADATRVRDGRREVFSFRSAGYGRMTVREENLMEEVLGPDNTSAQQWDSWQAVAGPRNAAGNPAALFDPKTGEIDRAVAEAYAKYDIARLVRGDQGNLGIIFKSRIRLVCGDRDSFFLNEAVRLLKEQVDPLAFLRLPEGSQGHITLVAGRDHGSVLVSGAVVNFPTEMVQHLRRHELVPQEGGR